MNIARTVVLAIDQAPKEKEGANNVLGRTVTLELKPELTATLSSSRQAGTPSLRSIADAKQLEVVSDERARHGSNINVVRYGVANQSTVVK